MFANNYAWSLCNSTKITLRILRWWYSCTVSVFSFPNTRCKICKLKRDVVILGNISHKGNSHMCPTANQTRVDGVLDQLLHLSTISNIYNVTTWSKKLLYLTWFYAYRDITRLHIWYNDLFTILIKLLLTSCYPEVTKLTLFQNVFIVWIYQSHTRETKETFLLCINCSVPKDNKSVL